MPIGRLVKQPENYAAFIPGKFPAEDLFDFPGGLLVKAARAERLVGKLDGITHILPDVDFFLSMYVIKDATNSAQIEGTKATIMDALEMTAGVNLNETDAEDILHYIKALNYGIKRLKKFPFSLRFIKEIHKELMTVQDLLIFLTRENLEDLRTGLEEQALRMHLLFLRQ